MKVLVTLVAVLAVATAAPTGKSWGVPISLAPQRVSYNYVPSYYLPVHLQRIVAPAPAPVVIPYSTGGSSRYHVQDEYGQYQYGYVNADGQTKSEIRGIDGSVAGKFGYYDPTGKHIELSYVADKDGFRASGDHLPKQVELPDDLQAEYDKANARLEQTRKATAIRRAYKAQKAALAAYQAAARSYSHIRPPTVYWATYPKAPARLVQTYAQPLSTPIRVVQAFPVPAQSKVVQTYVPSAVTAPVQPRPVVVPTYAQVLVAAPAAPSTGDDGGAEKDDDDDDDDDDDGDDHGDGKYDHEKYSEDEDEHDDGKYRPEENAKYHDDGQYRHDDAGDDDDDGGDDDDQDKGDGESDGDGDSKPTYTGGGVLAVVPGQAVLTTPVRAVQAVYAASVPAVGPVKAPAAVPSAGVYVAQTQTQVRPAIPAAATVPVARPFVYAAATPATVGAFRPAVYSVQAPTPAQASAAAPRPYIHSAPSQPSVSAVRPVFSAPAPVPSPLGVVRSTYTSPGPSPVSFSVSQPVAPPAGSPVIATKVKTYTSTGTVGSPYVVPGAAAGGAPARLSSYSVSAQIPVSSVPVATPQVTVPVYSGAATVGGAGADYKIHGAAGLSAPAAVHAPYSTAPQAFAAPQAAAAPAPGHVKSGYAYQG